MLIFEPETIRIAILVFKTLKHSLPILSHLICDQQNRTSDIRREGMHIDRATKWSDSSPY